MILILFQKLKYKLFVHTKYLIFKLFPSVKSEIQNNFHKLFYDSGLVGGGWKSTKYFGFEIQKCPLDLFVYQELIFKIKPDLVIETGTAYGGTTLYIAHILDQLKKGKIITVDTVARENLPVHNRINYITGSSTDAKVVDYIAKEVKKSKKTMVILDSAHTQKHVASELNIYSKFVSRDSYLIVEDTNVNGHPVNIEHGPGPMEAVIGFLKKNKSFKPDKSQEKFLLTFNPSGYLHKI